MKSNKTAVESTPVQPWIADLPLAHRAQHDKLRRQVIDRDVEAILGIFGSNTAFEGVETDALGRIALHLATHMTETFEEGVQVGLNDQTERLQAERNRHAAVEIARIGAVPGM